MHVLFLAIMMSSLYLIPANNSNTCYRTLTIFAVLNFVDSLQQSRFFSKFRGIGCKPSKMSSGQLLLKTIEIESMVRGYHVYKQIWDCR